MLVRAAFTLLILLELAGAFFFPEMFSDFTWLGLVATAGFVWAMIEIFKLSLPVALLAFVATVIDAISALFQLYSRIDPWDLWMHALGGAAIAAAAMELVRRGLERGDIIVRRRGAFIAASTYLIVTAVGFLYELLEYLVDKYQYGYPKSLVSAFDSIEDQVLNLVGASLVLGGYYLWQRRRSGA